MEAQRSDGDSQPQPNCNVNSVFNFTVGGIAIAVALLIGYLAYVHWWH